MMATQQERFSRIHMKALIIRCSTILQAMSSGHKINAEKFRDHAFKTAKLLVNEALIIRCLTILQAMSSGHKINAENFRDYAFETAKLR